MLGLAFGLAFFGATLYWILRFGELAFGALVLLSAAAIVAGRGAVTARAPSHVADPVGLGFAALWTVVEWIRGCVPFGGFTWGSVGVSQVDDTVLLRLASITGVSGITFVVVAVNALLVAAVGGARRPGPRRARRGRRHCSSWRRSRCRTRRPTGPVVDVAAIQVDTASRRAPPWRSRT